VSERGKKHYQQDKLVAELDVSTLAPTLNDTRYAYFAVYDGHGGEFSSEYLAKHLHLNIFGELAKGLAELRDNPEATLASSSAEKKAKQKTNARQEMIRKAILTACKDTDKKLLQKAMEKKHEDGSCALIGLIEGQTVWIANVGDSKAVLARRRPLTPEEEKDKEKLLGPKPVSEIRLSKDHTPVLVKEKQRIEKYGGFVDGDGRVCGRLGVSRSFNDYKVKKFGVVSQPDITKFTITTSDKFMLLACDGLWSVFTPEDAIQFADKVMKKAWEHELDHPQPPVQLKSMQPKETPLQIVARKTCQKLVREAVLIRGAKDNTSCICVIFGEPN